MQGTGVVVGGSSAIGAAIGHSLGKLGLDVVLWGRNTHRLAESRKVVEAAGGTARAVTVDVEDGDALEAAASTVSEDQPLRVVVWAAGVFDWAPAHESNVGAWERLLHVNLTAAAVPPGCSCLN